MADFLLDSLYFAGAGCSSQNRKLRLLKTVLGTAGIFPASRSCISPHPENKAKFTPKLRRKKSHSNGTAGRQGIKVF